MGEDQCGDRAGALKVEGQAEVAQNSQGFLKAAQGGTENGDQIQVESGRSPAMPEEPDCAGMTVDGQPCPKESDPIKGDLKLTGPGAMANNFWDKTAIDAEGGAIVPLGRTVEQIKVLGEIVGEKYMNLRLKHIENQKLLNDELLQGQSDAKKSYSRRVIQAQQFAMQTFKIQNTILKSKHAAKVYNSIMAELMGKITESVVEAEKDIKLPLEQTEKASKAFAAHLVALEAEKAKIVIADKDDQGCKDAKENAQSQLDEVILSVTVQQTILTKKIEVNIPKNIKSFEDSKKKIEESGKEVAEYQLKVKEATTAFDSELIAAVDKIKVAEDDMFAKFASDKAGATGELTKTLSETANDGSGKATSKASIAVDASNHKDGIVRTETTNSEGVVKDTMNGQKEGLPASLLETHRRLRGEGETETEIAQKVDSSLRKSHDWASTKEQLITLQKAVGNVKVGSVEGIDGVDTSIFSTAMTKVDEMVTTLKSSLDCLKDYMRYYQVGGAQQQEIFKTAHEAVAQTVQSAAAGIGARAITLKNAIRELLTAMAKQKAGLLHISASISQNRQMSMQLANSISTMTAKLAGGVPTGNEEGFELCKAKIEFAPLALDNTMADLLSEEGTQDGNTIEDLGRDVGELSSDMDMGTIDFSSMGGFDRR